MQDRKKRFLLLIVLGLFLVAGVTYAYFEGVVHGTGNTNAEGSAHTATIGDLILTGTTEVVNTNMIPGESSTYSFTIENPNDFQVCFGIYFDNVVNTFVNISDLEVSMNGEVGLFPTTGDTSTIIGGFASPANSTTSFTLTVTYKDVEGKDQTGDMGKSFSGIIKARTTECAAFSGKSTLITLQTLNPNIKVNESMNDQEGVCPSYDEVTKTILVTVGEDNASLLCEAEDDFGTSYYFRGNVINNYVSFAGFIWRIMRINGDGSVRLIYDGTQAYANIKEGGSESDGVNRQIGTRVFNSPDTDNAYVGYMFKGTKKTSYANTFDVMNNKNATSSTIKGNATTSGSIDYWYANNIDVTIPSKNKKYSDYVSLDSIFCNDKNIVEPKPSGYTNYGYNKQKTVYRWYYGPWDSSGNQRIKFTCVNTQGTVDSKNDAFSVSETGNGALTYPVALITSDEAVAAGAYNSTASHYLRTGSLFWTMSPSHFGGTDGDSRRVSADGRAFNAYHANNAAGVRPVLSIKPEAAFVGGDGTMNNPFVVSYD